MTSARRRTTGLLAVLVALCGIVLAWLGATANAAPSDASSGPATGGYPPSSPPTTELSSPSGPPTAPSSTVALSSSVPGGSGSSGVSDIAGSSDGSSCASDVTPAAGQVITVSVAGFRKGESVSVDMDSPVTHLAAARANAAGEVSQSVVVPDSATGKHAISVTGESSGRTTSCSVAIVDATASSSDDSGLSATGVAVASLAVVGLALIVAGGLMLMASRRGRAPAHN